MKKIIILALTIGLWTIQSCSNENISTDTQIQPQTSLAGNVYGLRFDTVMCKQIQPGTAHIQKLVFLDDSLFIRIIPTSCADIGKDFTCTRYYSGKYKMDHQYLTLTFDEKMAVHYIKSKNNSQSNTLLSTTNVELEKSDISIEKLIRRNCTNIPYFELCDSQLHLMAPASDTLANHIKYLKDENIWGKLFVKNNYSTSGHVHRVSSVYPYWL